MRKMNRVMAGFIVVFLLGVLLSGCKKEEPWKNWTTEQMSVDENGQVVYCIVENFDKNYYKLDELTGMVVREAAEFNGKNKTGDQTPVQVLEVAKLEDKEDVVRVVWQFDKDQSFAGFLGETLYFETLSEAVENNHVFKGSVLSSGGESITLDDANETKLHAKHVLITDAKTIIHLPYDALYYSHGVTVQKDGSIDTTKCEDVAVIILKK